ncbi:hypothetical protein SAMN05421847_3024, partial [Halpernia humi]
HTKNLIILSGKKYFLKKSFCNETNKYFINKGMLLIGLRILLFIFLIIPYFGFAQKKGWDSAIKNDIYIEKGASVYFFRSKL